MALHLVIGNKNYSSWSFRPWLAMKVAGIAFEETVISLEAEDFKARVMAVSGAGKVPVLIDGETRVWESLAILEYLAEKFPAAALWPKDAAARAHARAVAAEMHAGIYVVATPAADECLAAGEGARARRWLENRRGADRSDLARLPRAIRRGRAVSVRRFRRRRRHVCARGLALHTYAVEVSDTARAYMRAMMALPAWSEWRDAARREPWVLPHDEVDWPQVLRE